MALSSKELSEKYAEAVKKVENIDLTDGQIRALKVAASGLQGLIRGFVENYPKEYFQGVGAKGADLADSTNPEEMINSYTDSITDENVLKAIEKFQEIAAEDIASSQIAIGVKLLADAVKDTDLQETAGKIVEAVRPGLDVSSFVEMIDGELSLARESSVAETAETVQNYVGMIVPQILADVIMTAVDELKEKAIEKAKAAKDAASGAVDDASVTEQIDTLYAVLAVVDVNLDRFIHPEAHEGEPAPFADLQERLMEALDPSKVDIEGSAVVQTLKKTGFVQ